MGLWWRQDSVAELRKKKTMEELQAENEQLTELLDVILGVSADDE